MRYIKSITQQKLSFLLAIYIGLFMNGAVFYRRFGSYAHDFTVWKGISAVVELAATVLVTFFLLRLLSLFDRHNSANQRRSPSPLSSAGYPANESVPKP